MKIRRTNAAHADAKRMLQDARQSLAVARDAHALNPSAVNQRNVLRCETALRAWEEEVAATTPVRAS